MIRKTVLWLCSALLVISAAACTNSEAPSTNSDSVPADSSVVTDEDREEIERLSFALYSELLLGKTWDKPESENSYIAFYCCLNPDYPENIPADQFESFIQSYFDVSTDTLHTIIYYDPVTDTYEASKDITAYLGAYKKDNLMLDSITQETDGSIKVTYRTLWGDMAGSGDGSDSAFEGYILLTPNGEHYWVSSVTVTADYADKYNISR